MSRTQTFLQGPAQPELLVGISSGTADEDTDEDTEVDHLRTARVPLQRSVVAHDTPCVGDEQTHHGRGPAAEQSQTPTTITEARTT